MKILTPVAFFACLLASAAIAGPVEYAMDPAHSHIGISWVHLGFSEPRARFNQFEGVLLLDEEDPSNSSLKVTVPIASLDTGVPRLDEELLSDRFFDADGYPEASFESTRVEVTGEKTARVHGNLTIRGITRPVTLDVTLNGIGEHPLSGAYTAGFSAEATIRRSEFGIDAFVPMVSDEIRLFITTEASVK